VPHNKSQTTSLSANESILETIIDEFKNLPMDVSVFKNALYRISEKNLSVELSKPQLEVLKKSLQDALSAILAGVLSLVFRK